MRSILSIILLLSHLSLNAQSNPRYMVARIIGGEVRYKDNKNGKSIVLRKYQFIPFISEDLFEFIPITAKIFIKDRLNGGVTIYSKATNVDQTIRIELITSWFSFDSQKITTSTKGEDEYDKLQYIFTANGSPDKPNTLGILGKEQVFPINTKAFPLDENHYFLIEFTYDNETISKKIPAQNNSIIIKKNIIFRVDGKQIEESEASNMKLIYIDKVSNIDVYICNLKLYFEIDETIIKLIKAS